MAPMGIEAISFSVNCVTVGSTWEYPGAADESSRRRKCPSVQYSGSSSGLQHCSTTRSTYAVHATEINRALAQKHGEQGHWIFSTTMARVTGRPGPVSFR